MPALEKPGLPPITKTIFDQIDSPFGEPEALSAAETRPEPEPAFVVSEREPEAAAPLPMPAFLAPQPNPFPLVKEPESYLGEEAVVGPVVPLPGAAADEGRGRIELAQQLPEPIAAPPPEPVPPGPKGVEEPEDLPELRPLQEIRPYYDYFPAGSELYAVGPTGSKEPPEKALPQEGSLDRVFGGTSFMWTASNLYHNPLYFEDPELERYGHDHGFLQPAASIAKFGVQLVGLPYQMALDPMCRREYALGWYRPQEVCTPKKKSRIPFNAKAAATAAGAYTGLIFIFP